jgi:hypothetical protein
VKLRLDLPPKTIVAMCGPHLGTTIGGLCALEDVLSLIIKLTIATMGMSMPKPIKT